jgi:hypothetical protein
MWKSLSGSDNSVGRDGQDDLFGISGISGYRPILKALELVPSKPI